MPESSTLLLIVLLLTGVIAAALVLLSYLMLRQFARLKASANEQFNRHHEWVLDKLNGSAEALHQVLAAGRAEQHNVLSHSVQTLERKFTELQQQVDRKLQQTFEANRKDLSSVSDRLAQLHDATGKIVTLSKGVNELHTLLRAPKLRGTFGEWAMESMLEEVLGKEGRLYKRQYRLDNGTMADAAIFTRPAGKQVVCVDSKFPTNQAQKLLGDKLSAEQRAESVRQFRKDVLTQARSIAEKYINPPQTLGFAFLYVPAESIFQLILSETQLHEDLIRLNVVPTSPNSFYAYLQCMVFAMKGLAIQENALNVQRQVGEVARDFEKFVRHFRLIGTHLHNAASKYDESTADIDRFYQRVKRLTTAPVESPTDGGPTHQPQRSSDGLLDLPE